MKIFSNNSWDRLRGVIVGRADYANWPDHDSSFAVECSGNLSGPVPSAIIDEANEDLEDLANMLIKDFDVKVMRPDIVNWQQLGGMYNYCPRDTFLISGNNIIEAPMFLRARLTEAEHGYHTFRKTAEMLGCQWHNLKRFRPIAGDELYRSDTGKMILENTDPIFDAANVCRLSNNEYLYLNSCSGNREGYLGLNNVLAKRNVKLVFLRDIYDGSHIDTTVVPLREGLVMLNASRMTSKNVPGWLSTWEKIYVTEDMIVPQSYYGYSYGSKWMALNMFSIDRRTVVIDYNQTKIMKLLETWGITCVPMKMRHARTLGGGFHCVTLDFWRE